MTTDDRVSEATRAEEEKEERVSHDAGRGPTPDEEAAADRAGPASEEVAESYSEYLDTAKDVPGEGRIP